MSRRIRLDGYAIVTVSLKPIGGIPGDATSAQMRVLADASERFGFGELRVSHEQNIILPHVKQDDLFDLWHAARRRRTRDRQRRSRLRHHLLPRPRLLRAGDGALDPDRAGDLEALRRISRASAASASSASRSRAASTPAAITMSARSAFSASRRRAQESYQITLGGDPTFSAAIGELVGPGVTAEQVPDVIEHIVDFYLAERREGEQLHRHMAAHRPRALQGRAAAGGRRWR